MNKHCIRLKLYCHSIIENRYVDRQIPPSYDRVVNYAVTNVDYIMLSDALASGCNNNTNIQHLSLEIGGIQRRDDVGLLSLTKAIRNSTTIYHLELMQKTNLRNLPGDKVNELFRAVSENANIRTLTVATRPIDAQGFAELVRSAQCALQEISLSIFSHWEPQHFTRRECQIIAFALAANRSILRLTLNMPHHSVILTKLSTSNTAILQTLELHMSPYESEKESNALGMFLTSSKTLKCLKLIRKMRYWTATIEGINQSTSLNHVHFSGCYILGDASISFMDVFRKSRTLCDVDFRDCEISDAWSMMSGIRDNTSIKSLSLDDIWGFDENYDEIVGDIMKHNRTIRSILCSKHRQNLKEGCYPLADGLSNNNTLTDFIFNGDGLEHLDDLDAFLRVLSAITENKSLSIEVLHLNYFYICINTDVGISSMASLLQSKINTIVTLHLKNCKMSDALLGTLLELIMDNNDTSTLRDLDISENQISDYGYHVLESTLSSLTCLSHLGVDAPSSSSSSLYDAFFAGLGENRSIIKYRFQFDLLEDRDDEDDYVSYINKIEDANLKVHFYEMRNKWTPRLTSESKLLKSSSSSALPKNLRPMILEQIYRDAAMGASSVVFSALHDDPDWLIELMMI